MCRSSIENGKQRESRMDVAWKITNGQTDVDVFAVSVPRMQSLINGIGAG